MLRILCSGLTFALLAYPTGHSCSAETPQAQTQRQLTDGEQKQLAAATESYERALQLYRNGQRAEAIAPLQKAIAVQEELLGQTNLGTVASTTLLAKIYAASGKWTPALQLFDQSRRAMRQYVSDLLPTLDEDKQLQFLRLADADALQDGLAMGLARKNDVTAATLSAAWLLNGKNLAQEVLSANLLLKRNGRDPMTANELKELLAARARLASLAHGAPRTSDNSTGLQEMAKLRERCRRLESQLNRKNDPARAIPWIELYELRQSIPDGAMCIDFARVPTMPRMNAAGKHDECHYRYGAWLIPRFGPNEVKLVDLGDADEIDRCVDDLRSAMASAIGTNGIIARRGEFVAEQELHESLDRLSKLVFQPLLPALGSSRKIEIIPDGALWLIPWSALTIDNHKYAIEKYKFTCWVSGRDLMPSSPFKVDTTTPLVIADPDYDAGPEQASNVAKPTPNDAASASPLPLSSQAASGSLNSLGPVARLPGTAAEAAAICDSLKEYVGDSPRVLNGGSASEKEVSGATSPHVLVLSTHGYFLSEEKKDLTNVSDSQRISAAGQTALNPLVQCGLLLAGCNRRGASTTPDNDGVLTGAEIVSLDLRGTELVVLSACETGVGEIVNGEGVACLRQAFQLAGARAVVSALWQIPDIESAGIMSDMFQNLATGQSKADALRNAQLKFIRTRRAANGAAHPAFWAAFTLTGS